MKKHLAIAFGIIVFVLLAAVMIGQSGYTSKDGFPDLSVPEREIDPAQNPFPAIRSLHLPEGIAERVKALRETATAEEINQLLADVDNEMRQLNRYIEMTDWQYDLELDYTTQDNELQSIRTLAQLKRHQINSLVQEKAFEPALIELKRMQKLGKHLHSSEYSVIAILNGSGILCMAYRKAVDMIDTQSLSGANLTQLAEILDQVEIEPFDLANAYRKEYQSLTKLINQIKTGRNPFVGPFLYNPEKTKRIAAEYFREIIDQIPVARNQAKPSSLEIRLDRADPTQRLLSGNSLGYGLLEASIQGDGITTSFARTRVSQSLVKTRVALERYYQVNGDYPSTLEALIPEYIDQVPIDPMDGKPIRYRVTPETIKLYSVGDDFVDAKGATSKPGNLRDRKELVISIQR